MEVIDLGVQMKPFFIASKMAKGIESHLKASRDPGGNLATHLEALGEHWSESHAHHQAGAELLKKGDEDGANRAFAMSRHHGERMRHIIRMYPTHQTAGGFIKKTPSKKRIAELVAEHGSK